MFWKKKKPQYHSPQITDDNFNEIVAKSKIPVLLDFYADWCGPCKVLGPIIDELSEEYQDRALVAKVNTQVNPQLSAYFKIKSIPTMIIIHHGALRERFQGLIPKPNLEEILEGFIRGDHDQMQSEEEE